MRARPADANEPDAEPERVHRRPVSTSDPDRSRGWNRLWRKKPLKSYQAQACDPAEVPPPAFNWFSLMLLGVGTIVGVGIFVVTGQIAATKAGPAIIVSFAIAGTACGAAALCYAELASMVPVVGGSAYTYAYVTLGELIAWIIGWDVVAEYTFAVSAIASAWSGYAVSLLHASGWALPASLESAPITLGAHGLEFARPGMDVPAMLLVLCAGAVVLSGTRGVARFNTAIVALKLSVVALVIVFGLAHSNPANWHPFIPPDTEVGGTRQFGWRGVLTGAGLIFFSYLGFDTVTTAGHEAKNPQRTLPIAILGSVVVATILYMGMALTLTGLVPFRALATSAPLDTALEAGGAALAWLRPLVAVAALIGLASAAIALLYGVSRLVFAMALDGLLPSPFGRLSTRRRVPALGIIGATVFAAALAGLFPVMVLGQLISVGTLMAFCIVCVSVGYLRITQPKAPRLFRIPCWPLAAFVGLTTCLYLLVNIGAAALARLGVWMTLGLIIYFGFSVSSKRIG